MKDLNSKMSGLYAPSFFYMKIDAQTLGNEMNNHDLSLFIHEYIHFLQSFTTLYGLGRINADFSLLTNMINVIKNQQIIHVPLSEEEILNKQTYDNNKICNLTWGDTSDISYLEVTEVSIDSVPIVEDFPIDSVTITYKDKAGEESFCSFGAREIYEGMAYLIEQHITREYEISPDHPYNTAVKVIDYLYPEMLDDYRNLLVICDKALMSPNPGPEFIRIVQWLKQIKPDTRNPDKLYYFIDMNRNLYLSDNNARLIEFENLAITTKKHLYSLLQDEYFSNYYVWIDKIFDYAIDLRKTEPMFWLDIVDGGYAFDNPYFTSILQLAGSPLVENKKHEYFSFSPKGADSEDLVYFKIFDQINKLLRKGQIQCEMIPWCKGSPQAVSIDKSCYYYPWNHSESNGELCPYRGIWKHWGLSSCEIKMKDLGDKT